MRNYKIAVAGTGYVGLSLGVLLSQHHQVVAVDIVQAKVDMCSAPMIRRHEMELSASTMYGVSVHYRHS